MHASVFTSLLELTPRTGWSLPAILAECDVLNACERKDQIVLFCDNNADTLIRRFMTELDQWCVSEISTMSPKGITHKMHLLLHARYCFMSQHPRCFEGLFADLQNRAHLSLGKKIMNQTADHFWRACGDRSTDINYYSKRVLLMCVLAATTLSWMRGGRTPEKLDAEISRNLQRVVNLGKLKHNVHKRLEPIVTTLRDFATRFLMKP